MLDLAPLTGLSAVDFQEEARPVPADETRIASVRRWAAVISSRQCSPAPAAAFTSGSLAPDLEWGTPEPQVVFEAIQALYLGRSDHRDRQIAERLTALYRDALAEDEKLQTGSVRQFASFFVDQPGVGLPKITLTPDGTLRARWIAGPGNFTAIEFTGAPLVKLVAEIPRNGATAQYFGYELMSAVVQIARDIGATFA